MLFGDSIRERQKIHDILASFHHLHMQIGTEKMLDDLVTYKPVG